MLYIQAKEIVRMSKDDVWNMQKGKYTISCKDGEVETTSRRIILTWYYWRLYALFSNRANPLCEDVLEGGAYTGGHHLNIASTVFWNVYNSMPNPEYDTVYKLAKAIYEATNDLFNDVGDLLGAYVNTLSLKDLFEAITHPEVVAAKQNYHAEANNMDLSNGERIENVYDSSLALMQSNDPLLATNEIRKGISSGTLDRRSIAQTTDFRGYTKDINGETFPLPIEVSYGEGLSTLYDSATESCSAKRALYMQDAPLQTSEYFNRRVQLLVGSIGHVAEDDCGTREFLNWTVRKDDLKILQGKYFISKKHKKLTKFESSMDYLIGETIKVRSILKCANGTGQNVCRTCLGHNALIIPPKVHVGHFLSIGPCSQISQRLLSTKHLEVSMESLYLDLPKSALAFVHLNKEKKWLVSLNDPSHKPKGIIEKAKEKVGKVVDKLMGKDELRYVMRIPSLQVSNIGNLSEAKDARTLTPSRISHVRNVELELLDKNNKVVRSVKFDTEISGTGSALTTDFLVFAKKRGWTFDENSVTFDLKGWDFSKPFLMSPRKNEDMMSFLNTIMTFLLGSPEKKTDTKAAEMQTVLDCASAEEAMETFLDILTPPDIPGNERATRINVNFSEVEVFIRSLMCIDPDNGNYRMPIGDGDFQFVGMHNVIKNRSMGGAMAFGFHAEILTNPATYIYKDRPDHPLDMMLGNSTPPPQ